MGRFQAAALCRELGAELRKLRKASGLSEAKLARKMGWWAAKISRIESGNINASEVDVIQYVAYCGHRMDEVQHIIDLCRRAEDDRGYWLTSHGQHLEDSLHSLIFHETSASTSLNYQPHVVPGLLQTEAYARATMRKYGSPAEDEVALGVRARLERQRMLHGSSPGGFTFFIHENALLATAGEPEIMHEQLINLMLIGGLPHVTIRVVPASATFGGEFRLLAFAKHNPLVYLDCQVLGLFLEDPDLVNRYRVLVPAIADVALDEGESREVVATLANDYDRASARTDWKARN